MTGGRTFRRRACAAAFALVFLAAPERARAENAVSSPNLSGFWAPNWTVESAPEAEDLLAKLPEGAVLLDDVGAKEYGPGRFGGLKVKPEALAIANRWTPDEELKPGYNCRVPSIVYAMQGPFPMEIHQGRDMVAIKLELFDLVRLVFLDGRDHPPEDAPHSKTGHSTGRFEGDALIVDTTHLSPATITNNGLEHGARVHVIEWFRLSRDGNTLYATQYFEDPDTLDTPGARMMSWRRMPGRYVFPYECDPFAYVE